MVRHRRRLANVYLPPPALAQGGFDSLEAGDDFGTGCVPIKPDAAVGGYDSNLEYIIEFMVWVY